LHRGQVQKMGAVSEVLRPYQEFIDAYTVDANAQPMALTAAQPESATAEVTAAAAVPPTPPPGPKGTARIQSVRVWLDGQEGTELNGTSLVSRLQVDIGFASDPALPTPTAALVLSSESGKILGSCISHTQGVVFDRDAHGTGVGRITIERVPLNKGRYRVGAYLLCERGFHAYEMADPAAHITLAHPGAEQGTQLLNGTWSDGAGAPA
jgi:lipopolysaccharide transport system ATP-binding protein